MRDVKSIAGKGGGYYLTLQGDGKTYITRSIDFTNQNYGMTIGH